MNNVGKAIKNLANVLSFLGIICTIIFFLYSMIYFSSFIALIILIAGFVSSYIIYLLLYGYGELIENSSVVANKYMSDSYKKEEAENKLLSVFKVNNIYDVPKRKVREVQKDEF